MSTKIYTLFIVITILLAATACSSPAEGPTTIRIAALPVLDTLPIHVAQEEGLFEKYNVVVEVLPAGSAPKRDEMINAGQADGMVNEQFCHGLSMTEYIENIVPQYYLYMTLHPAFEKLSPC